MNEYENRTKYEDKKLKEFDKNDERIENNIIKTDARISLLELKIKAQREHRFDESLKRQKIIDRIVKRCKHDKYDRRYWTNYRDDRSFEKYCGCSNCGEIIWDECK